MRDGGRVSAAIEVLTEIEARHFPVKMALKRWGETARYAGSKDRAFVSGLVLDGLRRKRSLGWMMADSTARGVMLGVLAFVWKWPLERIAEAAAEEHGFGALTDVERERLAAPVPIEGAPAPVAGDYPDWLEPHLARALGADQAAEMRALSERAPVDLRVNTLKTDVERCAKALALIDAAPAGVLATAFRIPAPAAADRTPSVEAVPAFSKGWFEVQDLGSQIAAAVAGDVKGKQVLDFCAGGGGKTLALAAAMGNSGQIFAHDSDARRLADTIRRGQRAGVRNLQIRSPIEATPLKGLEGKIDVVFVDAPCTGAGTWRRHPDAKWRLSPDQLAKRQIEQDSVLEDAAAFVKAGGRMIYVTCSLLTEENEDRVAAFLERHPEFTVKPIALDGVTHVTPEGYLRLTPHRAGTDGFFAAVLQRASYTP
ncbi:RsmB/NOP family class I SAM-dependent RNA methyltransferase [Caulobacter vibrioides]|uniref:Sun family protein n=2 Tax=Caulobacter vibrioides TaxID=155892 RepID=Q9A7V0_CAUVC|nr:RsmB/NOP family class I SAM-dependent RNA methyltransferase [Caulobacter vibrioides]YP_002517064.1 tRNA/rRNA methyltransferase [Caulobacter vibrioides NA1000]AAK23598.1 sun family protein [Caulobacter vibrioides CB15]ACL95156.1 tRNA/rRNA methyltransferase [Caulobacter vibrioides NA1000]ATC28421.1 RsmB/NOP family class I SAM-dependent RNA methyltransferase [Caulobacter vibrioides]QXZ53685.1 RsmB/NOP family class I SAM-dependent RNA methyltransferase [Caulobacter vibrioides]